MGTQLSNNFKTQNRKRGFEESSSDRLKSLLVEHYSQAKQAYDQLPCEEDKNLFLNVFDDFSEAEFNMGAWRVEMVLDLIDDEAESQQKLDQVKQLVERFTAEENSVAEQPE